MSVFRPARSPSAAWNLTKTALQTGVLWGVLLFLVPPAIAAFEAGLGVPEIDLPGAGALAVWLFVAASVGGLWSGYTLSVSGEGTPLPFDTARKLVTRGPYRWVRNPMAVTGLSQGVAVGLWLGSPGVLVYVLVGGLLWQVAVRPLEERDLLERFGSDYEAYRARVRCWIPTLRPYDA